MPGDSSRGPTRQGKARERTGWHAWLDPTRPPTGAPVFAGFGPRALDFFRALAFHQDRTWFDENRGLYEAEVRAPLEALLRDLTATFEASGLPMKGDARSIFRLHRDVRFAKDKRPYKTNGGAVMTRTGRKASPGLLYVHLDPEGCFMAAGFYQPEPGQLTALRHRIQRDPAGYRAVLDALSQSGLDLAEMDDLKRLPRGFATQDEDLAAAFRKRHLVVRRPLAPEALLRPDLTAAIAGFAREAEPLLRFGWSVLDV